MLVLRKTALICILIFALCWADFRIKKKFVSETPAALSSISVPNPDPPVGRNLIRSGLSRLPVNALSEPETVRVCAIRVQFQLDSTPTSTGTGQFILETDDTLIFDPSPHNKAYFESHLDALARYYRFVSHGKIVVEYTVFPENENGAYTLPDSMGYYGPDSWFGSSPAARVGGFFTDALELADSDTMIDWNAYDVVIVFHAGSDWQNDIGSLYPEYAEYYPDIFIPSPDDLPSAYIVMFEPVVANVDRGIVMPEYCSQDGQLVLLNGTMAHEFGHALGLVDLYSTYDFWTMIGFLSLMDSGHNIGVTLVDDETEEEYTVSGALPVYPCAWERAYLGWETVYELNEPIDSFKIRGCELTLPESMEIASATIAKLTVDEMEYYLIENRRDIIWSNDDTIAIKQDSITGVILGIQVNSEFIGAYDFLLPGNGMIIWHIDERIAYGDYDDDGENNFQDNHLQWDWLHPFVGLVEADGIQDLGAVSGYYGEDDDFFKWPQATTFGQYGLPKPESWSGAYTGINISGISRSDSVMTFSFDYIGPHLDWRSSFGFSLEDELTIANIDGDSIPEILTTSSAYGLVMIWHNDGTRYLENDLVAQIIIYDGDTVLFPLPAVFEADTFTSPISVGDIDGDGLSEVIFGDDNGKLWALEADSIDLSGDWDKLAVCQNFPVELDGAITQTPILYDFYNDGIDEILIGTDEGILAVIYIDSTWSTELHGEYTGGFILPDGRFGAFAQQNFGRFFLFTPDCSLIIQQDLPVGSLNPPVVAIRDNDTLIILTSRDSPLTLDATITTSISGKPLANGDVEGALFVINTYGEVQDCFPVELPASPSAPVLANAASVMSSSSGGVQNYFQIIFATDSFLFCYHENGAPCENFPVRLWDDIFTGTPVIGDADGDGALDIIAASENARLYAIDFYGGQAQNFPISVGASITSPAIMVDDENALSLIIGSYEGALYRWDGFGEFLDDGEWQQFGLNADWNRVWWTYSREYDETQSKIVDFYNYPNPANEITYLRFTLNNNANYKVSIFSESGILITTFEGISYGGLPDEVLWVTASVASGLYIAVLEVTIGEDTEIRKHIIAIIK